MPLRPTYICIPVN